MKASLRDDDFRGHLPPPFYNGREDYSRVEYLSEPRPVHAEDETMAGRPGSYSTAQRPLKPGSQQNSRYGESDYRQYGDRRRDDDPERSWAREHEYREGYRTLDERLRMHSGNRGKGPRDYTRRDDRILEDLNEHFYQDAFLDASDIETQVLSGEVILNGTVEDREAKRRASYIAEMISGVEHVENRLRIMPRQSALRDERTR